MIEIVLNTIKYIIESAPIYILVFLIIFAPIIILINKLEKVEKRKLKQCPYCKNYVNKQATKCQHCHSNI